MVRPTLRFLGGRIANGLPMRASTRARTPLCVHMATGCWRCGAPGRHCGPGALPPRPRKAGRQAPSCDGTSRHPTPPPIRAHSPGTGDVDEVKSQAGKRGRARQDRDEGGTRRATHRKLCEARCVLGVASIMLEKTTLNTFCKGNTVAAVVPFARGPWANHPNTATCVSVNPLPSCGIARWHIQQTGHQDAAQLQNRPTETHTHTHTRRLLRALTIIADKLRLAARWVCVPPTPLNCSWV